MFLEPRFGNESFPAIRAFFGPFSCVVLSDVFSQFEVPGEVLAANGTSLSLPLHTQMLLLHVNLQLSLQFESGWTLVADVRPVGGRKGRGRKVEE